MAGTGAPLDFGYKMLPGVYTIVATSTTLPVCKNNMSGNVPITINPLPNIYTTTGGGNYCVGAPGARVGLSGSNTGVNYQLTNGGVLLVALYWQEPEWLLILVISQQGEHIQSLQLMLPLSVPIIWPELRQWLPILCLILFL